MKKLIAARNYTAALQQAAQSLKDPSNLKNVTFLTNLGKNLANIPREELAANGLVHRKIALLGGYTLSVLVPLIRTACFQLGIDAEILETEYGGLESLLLSRDSELQEFAPDFCYFCVGTEHLRSNSASEECARWTSLWVEAREFLGCDVIMNSFLEPLLRVYGNYDLKADSETKLVKELNLSLLHAAPSFVHFSDIEYLASYHGKSQWFDHKYYDLAKTPVAFTYAYEYALNLARIVGAAAGRTKKCLVLDLDNTLWGGVIGDDGLAGIEIGEDSGNGEAHKRLQTYIKKLKERGVILAVCSKNEIENAQEPFLKRTDMVLKLDDISCFIANWEPKHINIVRIAHELNIGLDSLVFLDDNPAEQEIVRANLPMVEVVPLGSSPAEYAATLSRCAHFETVSVTEEDRVRTLQYLENEKRSEQALQFTDYAEYLRSLEMRAIVDGFDETNIPRITQLIGKSNQFNLTTKRYSESEVRAMTNSPYYLTRFVKLKDKFGDNGLISVLIVKLLSKSEAEIDTWLMSCRVLKRGVEDLVFREAVAALQKLGVAKLNGEYISTAKNKMVKGLLSEMQMIAELGEPSGRTRYVMGLSDKTVDAVLRRPNYIELVSQSRY